MKRIIIICITLLCLSILSSCQLFDEILKKPVYEVTFNTLGGDPITAIEVDDFSTYDFNTSHIPKYIGHNFLGWYLDEDLTTEYIKNHNYDRVVTLFSKWEIISLKVSIHNTFTQETTIYSKDYGSTLDDFNFEYDGLIWQGFKHILDNALYDVHTPITKDLDLYTYFDTLTGYHYISFETNSEDFIANQTVLDGESIQKPATPISDTLIFYGWYLEPDYITLYDFNHKVTTDLTLYARYLEPIEHPYEIEDTILSWTLHPNAKHYALHILKDGKLEEVFAQTTEPHIDLKSYAAHIKDESDVYVYVVFESDESYKLFNLTLKLEYASTIYEQTFEDESFTEMTNYSNNSNVRSEGPDDFKYHILNGAVSPTNPIEGTKSVQLRNNTNIPYLQTDFYLEDIAEITFLAKSLNHELKVLLMDAFGMPLETYNLELSTNVERYTIKVQSDTAFKIKFELLATSEIKTGEQIFIDEIKVYGIDSALKLVEVIKVDEPDPDLEAIIARFATHRNNLTKPGFNALTESGKIAYYADLNGLTGQAFKDKLSDILLQTHRRFISYDEARFILEQSDLVVDGTKRYLDGIYSEHEIMPYWDGGATWAREHVWPNSRLSIPRVGGSSKNQGSDVHNLRAINPSVNSSRSNRYFLEGTSFGLVGTQGYYPGDAYKGDVARILFYMLARYPDILTLADDNIIDSAYNPEGAVMGVLSLLIKWHEEDPVSAFEIHRNEVIYTYQGNRNPFIDYPEYADAYFK